MMDNQGSIKLAENPLFHKRSKHIEIIFILSGKEVGKKKIKFQLVRRIDQAHDMLTKPLSVKVLKKKNVMVL